MTHHYAALISGLACACAGVGGELFVRGAVGLARSMRIAPGIVGATVAAFATSSPELSVSNSGMLLVALYSVYLTTVLQLGGDSP